VLLIDGDMRSPDLHSVFETGNDVGLAEILAGEATWQQAATPVLNERLDLIPAGILQKSPHELVARGAFAKLLHELREHYDTILIDTPPVLAAGEALALAAASDATVICAMQNKSCKHQIMEAVDRLSSAGANPIGMVLNGVPISRYAYAYGHYS
jgi:capsular exopolysaccharide synthesis family protein